jgi:hypothetical protein
MRTFTNFTDVFRLETRDLSDLRVAFEAASSGDGGLTMKELQQMLSYLGLSVSDSELYSAVKQQFKRRIQRFTEEMARIVWDSFGDRNLSLSRFALATARDQYVAASKNTEVAILKRPVLNAAFAELDSELRAEKQALLLRTDPFHKWPADRCGALAKFGFYRRQPAGRVLLAEGAVPTELCVIAKGLCHVDRTVPSSLLNERCGGEAGLHHSDSAHRGAGSWKSWRACSRRRSSPLAPLSRPLGPR